MKFIDQVWQAFFCRDSPPSTIEKPACMNITMAPVIKVQTMLIENRLWAIRSYRSVVASFSGTSAVPSAAGVAQTPAAPPVGSGQEGLAGSALVLEK